MEFKKKMALTFAAIGLSILSHAQTGIGTFTPDKSARLDVYSDKTGFLMPRVALVRTTQPSPVTAPVTSLMVYNTATSNDVTPGYYYWDGQKWTRIAKSDDYTFNNGLTANNGNVLLGGALTQPSVLTTTAASTLAIQGLQTGAASDNVLVADANGVLKYVTRASLGGGADNLGNHIATQDLNMNAKSITAANNITATGTTNTEKAAIALGFDGATPKAGDFATAADANGNIIWHTPSEAAPVGTAFFKYTLAVDVSLTAATGKIKFNNEVVDKSNTVSSKLVSNTASYSIFTAPKTGYYNITANVYQYFSSTGTVGARLFRSQIQLIDEQTSSVISTNELYLYTTSPYYWSPQMVTTIIKLNAGQRVSISYLNNFKATSGINANTNIAGDSAIHPGISYFSGYFISE